MKVFYTSLLWAALAALALLIFACILRAVRGPKVADRLVAVNMLTTLVSVSVCALTFLLGEDYLADVAILFSLTGCLAVVVLTRIFISLEIRKQSDRKEGDARVE